MKKRLFALLMCLLLCVSMLPVSAFAEGETDGNTVTDSGVNDDGTKNDDEVHVHSLTFVEAKEPYFTSGNIAYYKCLTCGKLFKDASGEQECTESDVFLAAKHTKPSSDKYRTVIQVTCTRDGKVEYTCADEGCDAKGTEIIKAHGHEVAVPGKEPTCISGGNIAYYVCNYCGNKYSDAEARFPITGSVELAPLPHTLTKIEQQEATCVTEGNKEYWQCQSCGTLFADAEGTQQTTLEAVTIARNDNHSLHLAPAKEATCTEPGNTAYWWCAREGCYDLFSDAEGTQPTTLEAVTIARNDNHSLQEVPAKDATCAEDGHIAYWMCVREGCGALFADAAGSMPITEDQTVVSREGVSHTLTHVPAKAATCAEAGHQEYWQCGVCGGLFADAEGSVSTSLESLTIPVSTVPHTLTHVAAKEATCAEAGHQEYWQCSVCGKLFSDENGTLETTEDALKTTTAHSLTKTEKVDATCTTAGNIEYWTCSSCGKLFRDEAATQPIQKSDTVIPASHTLVETPAKGATCTEAGNEAYWTCSVCEKIFSDPEGKNETKLADTVVAAKGHSFKEGFCTDCHEKDETFKPSVKTQQTSIKPGEGFTITIDADYDTAVKDGVTVVIAGKTIDSQYVHLAKGSVVVTIDDAALKDLKAGTYDVAITTSQGTVNTKLTVADAKDITISSSIKNGTVTASPASASEGEAVTLTIKPADGYSLKSLTVTDAAGKEVSVSGGTTTKTFTMPATAVTVTAEFIKVYTVTFDTVLPVDTITASFTQEVEENAKVTKPSDPTDSKQHHKFQGWYKDSAYKTAFDFSKDTITANTTLYAKWSHPYDEGICYYCWKANPNFSEVKDPTFVAKITRGNGGTAHYGYYSYPFTLNTSYEYAKGSVVVTIGGMVNGSWAEAVIAPSYYELSEGKSGGMVVSLKPALIHLLPVGQYGIRISTNLGTVEGAFRVSSSPKTSDDSNVALWVTVGVISAAAAAGVAYYLLKKRKK